MDLTFIYGMAIFMIALGLAFIYMLIGRTGAWRPSNPMEWLGTILAGLLVLSAGTLIVRAMKISEPQEVVIGQGRTMFEDVKLTAPSESFAFKLVEDDAAASLDDYAGNVLLINFWATWCAPCLTEMPDLSRLQTAYGEKGLTIINLSDEDPALLKTFDQEIPMSTVYAYMPDPTALPEVFKEGFTVRPSTFLIDRDGTIRRFLLGNRSYTFFEQAIAPYL